MLMMLMVFDRRLCPCLWALVPVLVVVSVCFVELCGCEVVRTKHIWMKNGPNLISVHTTWPSILYVGGGGLTPTTDIPSPTKLFPSLFSAFPNFSTPSPPLLSHSPSCPLFSPPLALSHGIPSPYANCSSLFL